MSDLISRQAAIDALHMHLMYRMGTDSNKKRLDEWINNLPPAEPERKKGKWIDYTDDGYVECPFCHSATNCDGNKDELHYCFSCGADMRGDNMIYCRIKSKLCVFATESGYCSFTACREVTE